MKHEMMSKENSTLKAILKALREDDDARIRAWVLENEDYLESLDASERAELGAEIFGALGVPSEEASVLDSEYDQITREVQHAVVELFLPRLPLNLQHMNWWDDAGGPEAIFDLSMAVGALLRRLRKFRFETDVFVLSPDGSVGPKGSNERIAPEVILLDLDRSLRIGDEVIGDVWGWFVDAARNFDRAIVHAHCEPAGADQVEVMLEQAESLNVIPSEIWRATQEEAGDPLEFEAC